MKLNELLKAIQPVQVVGASDIEITGINIDSRQIEAGHLFMAMRGTQTDGHAYIPAAIEKGAVRRTWRGPAGTAGRGNHLRASERQRGCHRQDGDSVLWRSYF